MKFLTIFTIRVLRLLLVIAIIALGAHTMSVEQGTVEEENTNVSYYATPDDVPYTVADDGEWIVVNFYAEEERNSQETALLTTELATLCLQEQVAKF